MILDNQSNTGQTAARAAAAAANIARGAAYGSIYGAATEAVKSFFPEIVKGIVIILFIVILTPLFIFTALPNIVFGYDNALSPDIVDFTASAYELDNLYKSINSKNQSLIDRLVDSILPNFWTNGSADYDDYIVSESLGGINQYWLIAIGSVRYKQDLYAMDESAIEALLYDKLDYSASVVDRILNISIWDLTPEAYMTRLGFSQEERDWAALLYSTLAEDQNVTLGDSDGEGYYNTD